MSSEKLSSHYDVNYILIAIRAQIEDYQFAYFLNKSPFFLFQRMEEDVSYVIDNSSIYFSSFYDSNEDLKRTSFLLKNRALHNSEININNGLFATGPIDSVVFLVPELREFDYFIKLVGIWKNDEISTLRMLLKNMKMVESEISVNLNKLKSINNLIF